MKSTSIYSQTITVLLKYGIWFMLFFILISTSYAKISVMNLRTEYKVNPIGIDAREPRFSWEIVSAVRAWMQEAYQIQAATDLDLLNDRKQLFWDTGTVLSDQSTHVVYDGPSLLSGQRIYWRVRVWDKQNKASDWSKPAFWEMGLLNQSDWQAMWIKVNTMGDNEKTNPCPMLRKEFNINGKVKSVRAYATSLGLYEFALNGKRVGDQIFTPGWTSYNKRLQINMKTAPPRIKT